MNIKDCKVGTKVWYYPDQTDKTKKIAAIVTHAPDYMWGDWACVISTRDCGNEDVPEWVNVNLLTLRK